MKLNAFVPLAQSFDRAILLADAPLFRYALQVNQLPVEIGADRIRQLDVNHAAAAASQGFPHLLLARPVHFHLVLVDLRRWPTLCNSHQAL